MNTTLLAGYGLVKCYPSRALPALDGVTVAVGSGEIIAVVGHNGAGKSTLFELLGGLSLPTAGTVELLVEPSQVGWCPQREIIDWSLTVRQNIALGLELRDPHTRKLAKDAVVEAAAALQLTDYLDRTAETLSGGELRRTQIARAMAGSPALMILDEPTTGLDPAGIEFVFKNLELRRQDGASALISTHETSRFSQHCTRVIAMAEGRVLADLPVGDYLAIAPTSTDDLWDSYVELRERDS